MKKSVRNEFVTKNQSRAIILTSFAALVASLLVLSLVFLPVTTTLAANPGSGSLAPTPATSVTWNGTAPGGASPEGEVTCIEGTNCETYNLTLSGTTADWAGKLVKVRLDWAVPATDYDMYIHKDTAMGTEVSRSADGPTISEAAEIDPSETGTGVYAIRVVYFAAVTAADQYRGTATVENKAPAGAEPTPPPVSSAAPPTYDNFAPPNTLGQRAGEPTIGLNWSTGKAMFIASLQTLRVTFNDGVSPATATWENKSAPNTSITSFDPILFTDSQTNRTFVSQLLPSKASLMSFTDDDGNNWTPSQGSGLNSGVDHQTVGGGPYARNADGSLKGAVVRNPAITYPNAVYYASQDIGVAEIPRSDDGGLTFGVAVPMYDITQCGGLHGHIKVAPDGTVYVPNKSCGGEQAVAVSEDNGLTWQIRKAPGSKAGRTDPSLGIATDGTIYFGYANGDGTARIAVSRDKGVTWENDQNIGFYQNIKNTVFPAVTAGDPDRAAFFFLGSTTPGSAGTGTDQTSPYFNGVWYGYISTTYDGGKTWVTVNATPSDPVQRGVICTNGTTCPTGTRNLLDFNDMEVDKQGRAVAALADGCITDKCLRGDDYNADGQLNTRFDNDGARRALIIRQASGLGLFAAYDPQTTETTTLIEDNDPRVEYSNGWHLGNNANASGGTFRFNNSKDATHFARLTFNVEGDKGSITYHYATSPKGGSAQVFIDGVLKQTLSFKGTQGTTKSPAFGKSVSFDNLSKGPHTLELRAINGTVYVDAFTLTSATTNSKPFSGPGTTSNGGGTAAAGQSSLTPLNVEPGTQAITISAGSNIDAPIQLVLIDPSGLSVATADASNGVAVINKEGLSSGVYQIKVVNLSLGPVEVWTAATPLVARQN